MVLLQQEQLKIFIYLNFLINQGHLTFPYDDHYEHDLSILLMVYYLIL